MLKMTALKPMTYATRRLKVGDPFDARNRSDARVLIALKKAELAGGEADAAPASRSPAPAQAPAPPPPPPPPPPPSEGDDLPTLRKQYEDKFGRKPFNGWSAETLRAKIDEA